MTKDATEITEDETKDEQDAFYFNFVLLQSLDSKVANLKFNLV